MGHSSTGWLYGKCVTKQTGKAYVSKGLMAGRQSRQVKAARQTDRNTRDADMR